VKDCARNPAVARHLAVTGVPCSQETATPPGTAIGPRHRPTVGYSGAAVSCKRGNPVGRTSPDQAEVSTGVPRAEENASPYRGTSLITCGDSENACLFLKNITNFPKNACFFLLPKKVLSTFRKRCFFNMFFSPLPLCEVSVQKSKQSRKIKIFPLKIKKLLKKRLLISYTTNKMFGPKTLVSYQNRFL